MRSRCSAAEAARPGRRRGAEAGRGGAAGARHRSRRGSLADDRRRQGRAGQIHHAALLEPSAICDARSAGSLRHQAERRRNSGHAGTAGPRRAGLRDDAAVERDRTMARPSGPAGCLAKDRGRHDEACRCRSAQFGDGGAGDCGGDAGGAAPGQIGGAGDAGSCAGAAGDGGAEALESRIRRFRRRRVDGYAKRHFCPPRRGSCQPRGWSRRPCSRC